MKKSGKKTTQERILDAAEAVFAASGWSGATTAEIARVAGVNEVTLFRQFGKKDGLMEAVVVRYLEEQQKELQAINHQQVGLRELIDTFSRSYCKSLLRSVGFVRTMIAESSKRPKQVQKVIHGVIKPLREGLLAVFLDQQLRGAIRPEVDCVVAMDLLTGMLFAGVVKPRQPGAVYSHEAYRQMAVEVFLRGVAPA